MTFRCCLAGMLGVSQMSIESAERLVKELLDDPKRLLEIADLPKEKLKAALRDVGFDFTPRELDDYVCSHYKEISALDFGEGDVRDIVMHKWGSFPGER